MKEETPTDPKSRSVDPAAQDMLQHAAELEVETAWDRHAAFKTRCKVGDHGLCCHVCYMGPCNLRPNGKGPQVGVCGADAHLIVARNLARAVAVGAAAHSDHGREVVEVLLTLAEKGAASGYEVSSPAKLAALAAEYEIDSKDRAQDDVIRDLANALRSEFGAQEGTVRTVLRAPAGQRERWEKLGAVPRGMDREVVDLLHRTHHGVEADAIALLRAAMRTALADGWGGSMIATDVSDILFGGPEAVRSRANLGVLEEDQVNILVHGHEPVLSEQVVRASREPELLAEARAAGAEGVNVAGICCTANEILMRQGMPVAGNYLHQELALLTGAVDAMVLDVQCILPSLPQIASCHHTRVLTTSAKARIPGATAVDFDPEQPREAARAVVRNAIEAYAQRDRTRVHIPKESMELVAGFTTDNLPGYMGGRFRSGWRPLNDAIASGRIRGVVGLVGCNTTKCIQDANHLALTRELLARDVLLVKTGCSAIASAKAGLMHPQLALEHAGRGLREVCEAVGIPPVLHMGSCVDNSRILTACIAMVNEGGLGDDISELPVAACAPEAMSEKAVAIGLYAVASGIFTAFMPVPRIAGSAVVREYLEGGIEAETGGKFLFTEDVAEAARAIIAHLDGKRETLKLAPMLYEGDVQVGDAAAHRAQVDYVMPKGVVALGCGAQQARSQSRTPVE